MFDRRLVQCFDWGLLFIILIILGVGLLALYSALYSKASSTIHSGLFMKQIIWMTAGLVVMFFSLFFNYRYLDKLSHVLYVLSLLMLFFVLTNGKYVGGSRRWLEMGPFTVQPSEFAKITVIIMLAHYYSRFISERGFSLKDLIIPFIYVAFPCGLIMKQTDLGTAMLIFLNAAFVTWFVKVRRKSILFLLTIIVISGPITWFNMENYQKERILSFLDPGRDPLGSGYHLIQSKIAIGSGRITGKGFLQGTQNDLSFLPEQHTDFIFSVFAEEWGFIGSISVVILYLVLILWSLNIANASRDIFGKIVAVGICSMIYWQTIINIGMVMGLMPVVGVPLPFMSYGGSSIITNMLGIGLLLNISMRRFMYD